MAPASILGCVPKKLMVYASSFSAAAADAEGFGWTVPTPTFDWATLIANKDREIERLNGIYRGLLEGSGVRIIDGRARLLDRHTVEVDGDSFTAERILIATGGRPFKSEIPGHDLSITSDEIFHLDRQPERIVIAGWRLHRGRVRGHSERNGVRRHPGLQRPPLPPRFR